MPAIYDVANIGKKYKSIFLKNAYLHVSVRVRHQEGLGGQDKACPALEVAVAAGATARATAASRGCRESRGSLDVLLVVVVVGDGDGDGGGTSGEAGRVDGRRDHAVLGSQLPGVSRR